MDEEYFYKIVEDKPRILDMNKSILFRGSDGIISMGTLRSVCDSVYKVDCRNITLSIPYNQILGYFNIKDSEDFEEPVNIHDSDKDEFILYGNQNDLTNAFLKLFSIFPTKFFDEISTYLDNKHKEGVIKENQKIKLTLSTSKLDNKDLLNVFRLNDLYLNIIKLNDE